MLTVYSFSAKTETDNELIHKLKKQSTRTGVPFSRLVLDALRSHYKETPKNEDK